MPHPQTTLSGTVLDDKYGLEDLLGHGGMGAVYRAVHLGTGRPVAVKLLLPEWTGDAEAVARFRREARASGALRHPNVVDVTDFGVSQIGEQDVAYLVMELLEGSTLRDLLVARGPLPLELVVEVTEQIAAALEAAHRAGIVHRDLKPDNIWLVPDARGGFAVRVLDFGIALVAPRIEPPGHVPVEAATSVSVDDAVDAEDATNGVASSTGAEATTRFDTRPALRTATPPTVDSHDSNQDVSARLTSAGSVVGTPYYMSPEQCQGLSVGPASDIYSLGVLVWEALSGFKPFLGTRDQVIEAHLRRVPSPIDTVAPEVSAAVLRAMSKSPVDRYQSARAFAGCLRAAAEGPWVILRRCVALYANRFPEMLAISWHCARVPVLLSLMLMFSVLLLRFLPPESSHVATELALGWIVATAMLLWMLVTMFTNATFALAIERLRNRPLENLDAGELATDLRRRLNLPPSSSWLRTTMRLGRTYLGLELRANAGTGDLAFLIGLLESPDPATVPQRCALLARGSRNLYRRLAAAISAGIAIPFLLEAGVLNLFLGGSAAEGLLVTGCIAATLIPINAMFINPVFSSALALLYFRARQAEGEDVALSAVLPGRL